MTTESRFDDLDLREEPAAEPERQAAPWTQLFCNSTFCAATD